MIFLYFLLGALSIAAPVLAQDAARARTPAPTAFGFQKLSPKDLISLQVFNFPEFSKSLRVGPDGTILMPLLTGRLSVEGLHTDEAEAAIAQRLQSEKLVENPLVTVTVIEFGVRPVSILGAVRTPASFQATGEMTLMDAIIQAGGFLPEAGSEILVGKRGAKPGDKPASVHISRAGLLSGDPESNIAIAGGEEIRVPYAGRVYILGDVKSPGSYPIQEGSYATVLQAVAQAGGLISPARTEAYVVREDETSGKRHYVSVPLKRILGRDAADIPLLGGDVLYIPESRRQREVRAVLDRVLTFGGAIATGLVFSSRR